MSAISLSQGLPNPLGATVSSDGRINFSVISENAEAIDLCLFCDEDHPNQETHRVRLPKRTGDVWHGALSGIPAGSRYGYRVSGPWLPGKGHFFNPQKLLLDPYARRIHEASRFHNSMIVKIPGGKPDLTDSAEFAPKGIIPEDDSFDWEADEPLCTPADETVIYEMHVKGFSRCNPDVPAEIQGTYAGLAHEASIKYLKELGITAVQLLPVHQHLDDSFLLKQNLVNYWGYNTLGFFAPEIRYAAGGDPVAEFREMVKALHKAGIEVLLDVVYNHTCEAGPGKGPTCFLRGFDNLNYYHTGPKRPDHYIDFTGCGNSLDVSNPSSLRLVMDSLRYWVEEMHVDGFRFDLAVELGRDPKKFNHHSAFFRAVKQDPVLCHTKLIAEPWDLGRSDSYQIGNFPINWNELNGKFRDCARAFWRGDPEKSACLATRLTGSEDLFAHNRRLPTSSVNMITSHDGFTLHDLSSYNEKHNEANKEKNRDGDPHNISYNHGEEGPTESETVNEIRRRQTRNFLTTMICSQGVPFVSAGDEVLRTQGGNNNAYCQDNEMSWLAWDAKDIEADNMRKFVARLLTFRREHPALRRSRFFSGKKLHGTNLEDVSWFAPDGVNRHAFKRKSDNSGAFTMLIHRDAALRCRNGEPCFLIFFFNAKQEDTTFLFPDIPDLSRWEKMIDTADPNIEISPRLSGDAEIILPERSMQIWRETV